MVCFHCVSPAGGGCLLSHPFESPLDKSNNNGAVEGPRNWAVKLLQLILCHNR